MNTGTTGDALHQESLPPKQKATCSNHVGRTTQTQKYLAKLAKFKEASRREFANKRANCHKIRVKDGQTLCLTLPSGHEMLFSRQDEALVRSDIWRIKRDCNKIYVRSDKNGFFHRAALKPPVGLVVDHKDGDGLNNTRENLRICTNAENIRNQVAHRDGRLRLKGVSFDAARPKNPFRAHITVSRKKYNLGNYATPEEAARVYDAAVVKYHGEFARLNFPPGGVA